MNPFAAIKTVLVTKLFNYSGRASRAEFWWYILFVLLIVWLYKKIERSMFSSPIRGEPLARADWLKPELSLNDLSGFILGVMLIIPFLSVTVRRLHDRNMTGWWVLLFFAVYLRLNIPFFSAFLPSLYLPEDHWISAVNVIMFSISAYLLFNTLTKNGTKGPNRFGSDPAPVKIDTEVFS